MDFNVGRASYYTDFFLVPLLVLGVLARELLIAGPSLDLAAAMVTGIFIWTFAEYWIHRLIFHHVFRRAHNLHHKRPRGYDAVPGWITACVHATTLTVSTLLLGHTLGSGFFAGFSFGYFGYILIHDLVHHRRKPKGWVLRAARLHGLHHGGAEKNFGVSTLIWDRVFGTFQGLDGVKKIG